MKTQKKTSDVFFLSRVCVTIRLLAKFLWCTPQIGGASIMKVRKTHLVTKSVYVPALKKVVRIPVKRR